MTTLGAPARSARVRSPNYPVISLNEAVQKVRIVYQSENRHAATREVVAKCLGYSSLNGASASLVSALVKYGLMQHEGDRLKISLDGLDLALHRKGDREYAEALQRAAFRPALFQELHEQYGTSLPSDHNLRASLQKRGFNPKVVDTVIRLYRDTLEFVESETEGFGSPPGAEAIEDEAQVQQTRSTTDRDTGRSLSGTAAPGSGTPLAPNEQLTSFRLSEDSTARIIFSGPVTQNDIDLLVELLKLNKRAYPQTAIRDEGSDEGPDSFEG